jgi:hypothetical protein
MCPTKLNEPMVMRGEPLERRNLPFVVRFCFGSRRNTPKDSSGFSGLEPKENSSIEQSSSTIRIRAPGEPLEAAFVNCSRVYCAIG